MFGVCRAFASAQKTPQNPRGKGCRSDFSVFFRGFAAFSARACKDPADSAGLLRLKNLDAETAGQWRPTAGSGLRVVRGSGSAPALRRHAPTGSGD